jgi:hypothetical protein
MREPKKIYGPYDKRDGRQVIILQYEDKTRRTVSYPKYLMEVRLGRELDPDEETVDHIDRDFTNNEWWNLRVIERPRHTKEDAKRRKPAEFTCMICETVFEKNVSYVYTNRKAGKAGPFCSRECAGTYGMKVKKGEIDKEPVDFEEFEAENKEYYRPIKREKDTGTVACKHCLHKAGLSKYWRVDEGQDEECDNCGKVDKCVYVRWLEGDIYFNPAYEDEDGPGLIIAIGDSKYRLALVNEIEDGDEIWEHAEKIGTVRMEMKA